MSYTILRFVKRTGGATRAIEAHHERKKEAYDSNPDIDISRSENNYHLIKPTQTCYQEINQRIEKNKCKVRSNSIKFVDTLITSDNVFFKNYPEKEYFQIAFEFMCDKVGKENIFSAVVHNDEKTPHMHLCFTPITTDGRLTAKEILGNKAKMTKWQDEFHKHMSEKYPILQRGKPASETNREHIPVKLFKEATALNSQLKNIEKALGDINVFNANKKRDNALILLKEWFPKVSSFISEMNKYNDSIDSFKEKENELMAEIVRLNGINHEQLQEHYRESGHLKLRVEQLSETLDNYKKFLSLIPKNIYSQVYKEYEKQQEIERSARETECSQDFGND